MSILNLTTARQSLILAGSLSLSSGMAIAQTPQPIGSVVAPSVGSAVPTPTDTVAPPLPVNPEGRAGIATLCIEKRSYVDYAAKIIRTPHIYLEEIPIEGINTGYIEGNAASMKWKDFLNPSDPKKKAWLEDTDIPEQAEAAIKLVLKLDKDKNGIVTRSEYEAGEKGVSRDDQLTDLAFLKSLECDNLFFIEGALNTVDVNKFQEVIDLKTSNALLGARLEVTTSALEATQSHLEAAQSHLEDQNKLMMMLAGLAAVTTLGMTASMIRQRRYRKRTEGTPQPKTVPTPPEVKAEEKATKPAEKAAPKPTPVEAYAGVLGTLEEEAPNDAILRAIEEGDQTDPVKLPAADEIQSPGGSPDPKV